MEGFSIEDAEVINQMRSVLKLEPGEEVYLGNGAGKEGIYRIENLGKNIVIVSKVEDVTELREPVNLTHLYLAILKADRFELAVQKATELGVTSIIPIITARTVKKDARRERIKKIILEAAEQSGRQVLPKLYDPLPYEEALAADEAEVKMFLDSEGEMVEGGENIKEASLYIGPEGGWTDEEKKIAMKSGLKKISLGKTTLRAETATIVALTKVIHF
jgi:16S rRNA (uracil1498-N3)-methyltransferase